MTTIDGLRALRAVACAILAACALATTGAATPGTQDAADDVVDGSAAHADVTPAELDAAAARAYRDEDLSTAEALWREGLRSPALSSRERARWMTNLGNVAARDDRWTEAAAWFEGSLLLRPRDAATRAKMDHARAEAGWPPADRGDLASTTRRVLGAVTEDEARWIALFALLPLAVALGGEALRGGRAWRRACWIALALWLVGTMPCVYASLRPVDPVVVTAPGGAAARSEPRTSATRLERLPAGSRWERVDALGEWTKLRGSGESGGAGVREVWVPSSDVFRLRPVAGAGE